MLKWNITFSDIDPDTNKDQQHYATVYAKNLLEAVEKIEAVTGRKMTEYTLTWKSCAME